MVPRRSWILGAVLAPLLNACDEAPMESRVSVMDSAGIRIVMNHDVDAPAWTVGDEPVLDLGTVAGEGPEQFFRVAGARILGGSDDERLVVANGGSGELRFFDLDGNHLRSFGQQGEGPGELRFAGPFWQLPGDSLAIFDLALERLSVFASDGSFGRQIARFPLPNPRVLVTLPDGDMIVSSERYEFGGASGFETMDLAMARVGPDGAVLDTLPLQPLGDFGRLEGFDFVGMPLFGPYTWVAADTSGYWVATGREAQLLRYTPTGRLEAISRWPPGDRTVPAAAVSAALETELAQASEREHSRIRARHEATPVADRLPSTGMSVPGLAGEVWVEIIEWPLDPSTTRWRVFDPDGRLSAQVSLPARLRILEVGADYLMGVHVDDLGVEHVRMYALSRTN